MEIVEDARMTARTRTQTTRMTVVSRVRRTLEVLGGVDRGRGAGTAPKPHDDVPTLRADILEIERRLRVVRDLFGGEDVVTPSCELQEVLRRHGGDAGPARGAARPFRRPGGPAPGPDRDSRGA